jgi:hypothetical protein
MSTNSQKSFPDTEITSQTSLNYTESFQTSSTINCESNQLGEENDDPELDENTSEEQWSHLSREERVVLRSISKILKRN